MRAPAGFTERRARGLRIALVALALSLAGIAAVGVARAATPTSAGACAVPAVSQYFAADATKTGVIDLVFFDAEGSPVTYYECVGGRPRRVGSATAAPGSGTFLATAWSCTRVVRRFAATATLPSGARAVGSYSVRTPSCAARFELRVPRRVEPGAAARIRVVDRWGTGGIRPQLCITPPHAARACRTLAFARAVAVAGRRFRASTGGRWRVELRIRGHRIAASIAVGGARRAAMPPALPRLLATGDSTMQGIDNFLADDISGVATVRSAVRPGTGISKLNPWALLSAQDTRRQRQDISVVSIGANDAWPMTTRAGATVTCCAEPWVAEYVTRVRAMMHTYLRDGRGRVLWLTLPVPRDPRRVPTFAAVNRAVLRAADGLAGVTVLRMDLLFSPHGYQDVMRYRGRDVHVREPDGIHLNVPGTAIAATAVAQVARAALRAAAKP
jgi:lysophospholipase L1-like esterase